jgi:putative nucleotidyltransferase with HDIG domain
MKINNSSQTQITEKSEIPNGADTGLCLLNRQMEIIWLSKTMESWFGVSGELIGKKCYICFERKNIICKNCPVKKAFRDKNSHTSSIKIRFTADGKKKFHKLTATPILNNQGEVENVLETAIDIAEKRKRDIKNSGRAAETQKSTKEIIQLGKSFKKLADRHSAKLKLAKKELKTIHELGNRLIYSLDVKEILYSIANIVTKLLKVSGCVVRIVDETKTKLKLEAAFGVSDNFQEEAYILSIDEGVSGAVIKNEIPITISDISKDKRVRYYAECLNEGMRSLLATPIIFKNDILGVIIAFSKKVRHFNKSEINLLSTFAAYAAIALDNAMLYNKVHLNYYNTMITLIKAMEARDPYTCGHSERVTNYAIKIAKKLNLSNDDIELLMYAGKLHDIGKIAIPDFILKKTATLTPAERAEIEAHPVKGIEMINNLKFLKRCIPLIRHHHERYDGSGYPDKLKGEEIPFLARILSIADAFDAMTSERPYRRSLKLDEAIEEIKRNSRTQFDPQLSKLFVSILQKQPGLEITNEATSFRSIHLAN